VRAVHGLQIADPDIGKVRHDPGTQTAIHLPDLLVAHHDFAERVRAALAVLRDPDDDQATAGIRQGCNVLGQLVESARTGGRVRVLALEVKILSSGMRRSQSA
jgi:hypothetical protein